MAQATVPQFPPQVLELITAALCLHTLQAFREASCICDNAGLRARSAHTRSEGDGLNVDRPVYPLESSRRASQLLAIAHSIIACVPIQHLKLVAPFEDDLRLLRE